MGERVFKPLKGSEESDGEATRAGLPLKVEGRGEFIILRLNEGEPEHWAHFEGEVVITFDKYYKPLKVEIEVKDTMDSEKALPDIKGYFTSDTPFIEIDLVKDGEPEHWAHFEGEVVITFDKYYKPLKVEIEVKDTMDSEKVLRDAGLLPPRREA
ncbi:hypothetical protein [Stygiolobus caldivivus]|uniref:Uncharacterized protein n=1 Tax=Stygiolobus caldivivus TaxID=2824673 RepID=A0A8D5ZIX2_9CREN|nr:hypothetical protein [Stygiolobus caldivivus]BCU70021.1 hypothetical protein KN1_13180 [Stygiolobus caldivivus]